MAKHEPLKPRGKVDPKHDWRVVKVIEIDHFTAMAWERNGLGEIRPIRGLQQVIDPDFDRHVDDYYDRRNDAILAERARLMGEADAKISQLRRKYQAQGRVVRWGDLARELKLDAARAEIGKPATEPKRRSFGREPGTYYQSKRDYTEEGPIIRVDDIAYEDATDERYEPADDRVHEEEGGE